MGRDRVLLSGSIFGLPPVLAGSLATIFSAVAAGARPPAHRVSTVAGAA
ncbi:hypothetical protein ACIQRK_27620 [Streptomyces anulatus]